ncbi:MAG: efflux RND transporter permease subunit [Tropicimonas sp.]|uniref:efflux RND transporter permease subunit n=1 Tax=Tropicimonas sp. TaxID=2067044 RepID=UPI003A8AECCF
MMTSVATAVKRAFTGVARFFFRLPLAGIVLIAATFALALGQARSVTRDGSIEGFFRPDAPEIAAYDAFRRQFGQEGQIIVGVESGNLFTAHMLHKLAALHEALAQGVPYTEDITSLMNTRAVEGGEGLFVVNDLLQHFLTRGDTSPEALAAFRETVLSHPVYRDLVISQDGQMTLITIRPQRFQPRVSEALAGGHLDLFSQFADTGDTTEDAAFLGQREQGQMVAAVQEIAARFEEPDFRIHVAGSPVASSEIVRVLSSDMPKFTLACMIAITLVVVVFTRRLSAAVAFIATVAVSAVSTIGLMAATGTAIKAPTQVLPSIIIVAAACTVLHLIAALVQARAARGPASGRMSERACKELAVGTAMDHAALPVAFTTLTTAVGLASFSGSSLAPVADLGIFGAIAVILVLVSAMIVVPVVFRLFRFRAEADASRNSRVLDLATRLACLAARHWSATLQLTALVTVIAGLGLFGLRFHHNSLEWLPETNQVRVDTETVDARMRGAINLEAVVDTGTARGVQQDAFLAALDDLAAEMPRISAEEAVPVGKVFGVTDLVKEVNQALIPSGPAGGHRLPEGQLVAREFLMFENSASNDLPDFVDSNYQQTRLTVRVPWLEAGQYAGLIDRIESELETRLAPVGVSSVTLTGNMALLAQTSVNVIRSMAESYGISLVAISLLMALIMGGVRLGLAAMVPNLLPVVIVLGVMGFAGVPFDSFTMLIGCIALGLIVDDTIHFFYQLRTAETDGLTGPDAITYAVRHSFLPILATSLAVMAGFAAYALSTMSNVTAFGLLIALVSLVGLIAETVVSPAIYAALLARRTAPERAHDLPVGAART